MSGFTLSLYPWLYTARYSDGNWEQSFVEKSHTTAAEEAQLDVAEREMLNIERNSEPHLPLVNYTTQYGYGCFEGLKAYPRPDGMLQLFRPDENAQRMFRSMRGMMMPGFPEELFVSAVTEVVRRNRESGYSVQYDPSWSENGFLEGHSIYIRPFTYSEAGIGLNMTERPWVVIIITPVGSYFDPVSEARTVTTKRVRATEHGTGWIKCSANYVIPIMAKHEAQQAGYMEAIFLDGKTGRYVEEGSSCNIFFRLRGGTLVTPVLNDRILPGINRKSVITLARDLGVTVEERTIEIEEVLSDAVETFLTGTAAGVTHVSSVTHEGRTAQFGDIGQLTRQLRDRLKGIQYGALEDRHGWMKPVG